MTHAQQKPVKPVLVDGWYVAGEKFPADPIARLVYYARLAPSTHNSQPWKFVASASEIDVFADLERWRSVADAQQRELHVSLGCAIESLRIAADFAGWGSELEYFPLERDQTLVARVRINMTAGKRHDSAADLLGQMVKRHTSHRLFDPARPVGKSELRRLYTCLQASEVSVHFLEDRHLLDALAAAEMRADAALLARPEYRSELARGIGEGALSSSWLLSKIGQLAMGHLPLAERAKHSNAERLASAPLVGLLTTRHDRRTDQLQAGEGFMRVALVAEAHDIRVQPLSQILEVAESCAEVSKLFGLGERVAQHLFRLGHAQPEEGPHRRRPVSEVLLRINQAS
jgi:hypothetical protein